MDAVAALKRGVSRQFSLGSLSRSRFSFGRHASLDPRLANARRFAFGRQSSLDPNRRSPVKGEQVGVPENLDATMQLLFLACQGDAKGVEDLLKDGVDVNSIDLDGRTALHIAACEGHVDVVKLLLSFRANIDARDRWGSTAAADAKHYGNAEVYDILKARGAKTPKARKTPMAVSNPQDVPEYELNPAELYFRQAKWNGIKVSVKMLEQDAYSDPDTINAFKNELTLMQKVRHPNLVQFVGAVTQNIPMMIVYEYLPKMIEGVPVFHPKAPGDVAQMICLEGIRPILKTKSKAYPPDLNELIEECWNPQPVVRPTFSEIILRLDKMYANCPKPGRWKENFKLPWK
ncbi:serine threonine protein kinase [Musa troglodytarum]|uniref:Serine threonine protein kinase n=1 Tax=Musa troglodytarum TaxID=320322 RepID=A0A9E7F1N0_9LILI|nr:serine threonine protein kinase [Musa troglodytarum]